MFRPKIKLDVFFPDRKAVDERWEVVEGQAALIPQLHWKLALNVPSIRRLDMSDLW